MTPAKTFIRDRFTWLAYFMLAYYSYNFNLLGPLMPFLRRELNLSYTVTGLHLSAFALGMALAGFSADHFAKLWGRWPIFWGGGGGMALGAVALVLSPQVALTILSAASMGYLGSLLLVMIQTTLSDRHGEQRAIALTESNVGASLTASLGPMLVGGFEAIHIGWRGALFLGVACWVLMRLTFQTEAIPGAKKHLTQTKTPSQSLPMIFWAYWLVNCLSVSIEWCFIFWGADFLEKVVGLSQVNAVTLISVFLGAMVLGRFLGSRLSRRRPSAHLLVLALIITLIGFPIFWLVRIPFISVTGLFIAGFGVANLFPLNLATALQISPQQVEQASARISMGSGLAILLVPLLLGWIADQLDIQNAYGLVGVIIVLALGLTLWANRTVRQNQMLM
jgi:MFS family permease